MPISGRSDRRRAVLPARTTTSAEVALHARAARRRSAASCRGASSTSRRDQAGARRRLRGVPQGHRGPQGVDDDGVREDAGEAAARQGDRQARRADRARRSAHVRHGVAVPRRRHLLEHRPALRAGRHGRRCCTTRKRRTDRSSKRASPRPGSISSFIAAGTAYATHGVNTIPFFIFYSMFGFQRVGDFIWAAADARCRGFLLGGTAGRTTLAGEGLQHQDGNSHVLALPVPTCRAYDPAYAYELAVIIQDGIKRMYGDGRGGLLLHHRDERAVRDAADAGGRAKTASSRACIGSRPRRTAKAQGARAAHRQRRDPERGGARRRGCSRSTAWRPTSGARRATTSSIATRIASSAGTCCIRPRSRACRTSPSASATAPGVVVAASDYLKSQPDMIARWVGRPMVTLGTDGFGRSEDRASLRNFFEVDARHIAAATLSALAPRQADRRRGRQAGVQGAGDRSGESESGTRLVDLGFLFGPGSPEKKPEVLVEYQMPVEFTLPELGENVEKGDVVRVLV